MDIPVQIQAGLISAGVAFLLIIGKEFLLRRRKHRAYLAALRSEILFCSELAESVATAGIKAPLYRLPTIFYKATVPELLEDGQLSESQSEALMRFYNEVETLNRGLNSINWEGTITPEIRKSHQRNCLKAERIASDGEHFRAVAKALQIETRTRLTDAEVLPSVSG